MQKSIFTLLLLPVCISSQAQIKKGASLLSSQFSYSDDRTSYQLTEEKNQTGLVKVLAGKLIQENKVLGVTAAFSAQKQKTIFTPEGENVYRTSYVDAGIFFRQYKGLGKKIYLFGQADAAYFKTVSKSAFVNTPANNRQVTNGARLELAAGLSYQLLKKMQVELALPAIIHLQYFETRLKNYMDPSQNRNRNSFSVDSNLSNAAPLSSITVGFTFVF